MLYLSEVIGKRIVDQQGNRVARVRDLVAEVLESDPAAERVASPSGGDEDHEPVEYDAPIIKGLLSSTGRKHPLFFVPIDQFEGLQGAQLRLRSSKLNLQPFERRPTEILLSRDLWDKQVIDLENRRVVRVNDVVISDAGTPDITKWWVRGVDIGLGGLVRRLRLTKVIHTLAKKALQPRIVRWTHLDVFGSNVLGGVELPHKKLSNLHPVEIARITDAVSYHQGAEIIAALDDTLAADTLEEIEAERQTDIVEYMPEERAADILEEMAPDEASDLLAELSEEKAGTLLEQMDEEEAEEVRYLMRYPEHSAGGLMTTDFVHVFPSMTVDQVIQSNRDLFLSADLIYYMYVLESEESQKLVGVITVRDLLVHERDTEVAAFMLTDFLSVRPGEKHREVARKMAEYNLLALPVVDRAGELLGVVTVDDALDALLPEGWKKRLPRIFS